MDFNNKLKPAPITSATQTELDQLAKEYAKWFDEYVSYDKSKGVDYLANTVQANIHRISARVTELVGDDARYNVLTKYLKVGK
jgi:hypothetical protein